METRRHAPTGVSVHWGTDTAPINRSSNAEFIFRTLMVLHSERLQLVHARNDGRRFGFPVDDLEEQLAANRSAASSLLAQLT